MVIESGEGVELVAVEQRVPLASEADLRLLRSSLSLIAQQGGINATRMAQQIESSRTIVRRKVELMLESGLSDRSDALEMTRLAFFANGFSEDGGYVFPEFKVAVKSWPVLIEALDVLIEERRREDSTLGKRSADELGQNGELLTEAQKAFQASQLGGVTKTPAALQADPALRAAAMAVLTGSAGLVPPGSEASGKTITWLDVDMSLANKDHTSDGQLLFDPQSDGGVRFERHKKPTEAQWREFNLAHINKLSGIQKSNFIELIQLYETLLIGHGFFAVYMFSLDVKAKDREFPNRPFSSDLLAARFQTSEWYRLRPIVPVGPTPGRGAKTCTYFNGRNGCDYPEHQCRNGLHQCSICGRDTHPASKCFDNPHGGQQAGGGRGRGDGRGRGGRHGRGRRGGRG